MFSLPALALILVGAAHLVLTGLLPILAANRADRHAAQPGAAPAVPAGYVSPAERLARALPGKYRERYRRPVDVGYDFSWGRFLDRQLSIALIAAGVGLYVFETPASAALAFILAPGFDYLFALRRARAFRERFLLQLPGALLLVSGAMAGGRDLADALTATTPSLTDPIRAELNALAARIEALRVTEAQAFEMLAEKLPYPELRTIGSALAIGNQIGLETHALLRSLSGSIQEEIRARNELEAVTSQVRSTATVISYLPVAFVLFVYFLTPRFVEPLFGTLLGWVTILVALALNYLARWWTARILRRIEA